MSRIAIFPGSFDPITVGHESIVNRALSLFDQIIIAVGVNATKNQMFSPDQRVEWIKKVFENSPKISVVSYTGMTIDLCKKYNAGFILRGLRTSADFEFERSIGQVNKKLYPEIDTVFLLTSTDHTPLNSSIVRDIIRHDGEFNQFIPKSLAGIITKDKIVGI